MIDRLLLAASAPDDADAARVFAMGCGLGYEMTEAEAVQSVQQDADPPASAAASSSSSSSSPESDYGKFLALAAPPLDVNPASQDAEIALHHFRRVTQAIDLARRVGARALIFHSAYLPLYRVNGGFPRWIETCADFWRQMIDLQLVDASLTLYVANVMEESPDQLLELCSRVNSPRLRLCLDVGALSVFSATSAIDWLDALQHQIGYVRIANTDGKTLTPRHLDHQPGAVEIAAFINHLTLLPQRFHTALVTRDPARDYQTALPYYRLQQARAQTRSMLL